MDLVSILGGRFQLGGIPLILLASISLVSPLVSAASEGPYSDLDRAAILVIPLRGIAIIALVSVFYILRKDPPFEPAWFHISNILAVILLLTLIDAFTTPFAFLSNRNTTFTFTILGLTIVVLYTFVLSRYLLFPLPASAAIGAVFAGISILWWAYILSLTDAQVDDMIELMAYLFLGGVFIMVSLLILETVRHRLGPGQTSGEDPEGPVGASSIHERTQRMGEMLLACMVLGIVVPLLW